MSRTHESSIALDARPLAGTTGRRGVGAYVSGLVRGLTEIGRSPVLLVEPGARVGLGSRSVEASAPPGPALLWGRVLGPRWLRRTGAAVWHATFLAPPRVPSGMGSVATIHDLIPLRHPTLFSRRTAFVFRRSLTYAAQAERVVAVSSHTADEARRALGIAAERLTVVPPPVELGETTQEVPPVQPPYVLHMSGFDPLKGVTDLLLPAFARISGDAPDVRLVMTGPPSAWRARAQRTAEELGMASRVVFAGLVAPSTRVAFLEHAAVVVVSSHEEGFGMPAIEGLAAGLPVAVGPAAATREAVGELGHLAGEPTPESLAATLQDALRAPGPDSETAEARRKHARRFSAASVARRLAELYDEVAP